MVVYRIDALNEALSPFGPFFKFHIFLCFFEMEHPSVTSFVVFKTVCFQ